MIFKVESCRLTAISFSAILYHSL